MARSMMTGVTAILGAGLGAGGELSGVNTLRLNDGVTDQYVSIEDDATLDLTTGATVHVYASFRSTAGLQTIIAKYQDGIERSWYLFKEVSGEITVRVYIGGTAYEATSTGFFPIVDTFYTFAFTYDGNDIKLYINGNLEDTTTQAGSIDTSVAQVRVGGKGDIILEDSFLGDCALAVIYNSDIGQSGIDELQVPKDPSLYTQANMVMGIPINIGSKDPTLDTTSNGNDATLNGASTPNYNGIKLIIEQASGPVIPDPASYNTYLFDASGKYVTVANAPSWAPSTGNCSYGYWVNISTTGVTHYLIAAGSGGVNYMDFGIRSNGRPRFTVIDDGAAVLWYWESQTSLTANTWHLVVMDFDGYNTGKMYIDGVSVSLNTQQNGSLVSIDPSTDLFIGRNSTSSTQRLQGNLSSVFKLNRSITSQEAADLYVTGPSSAYFESIPFTSEMGMYLEMNDRNGLTDLTPNGNDGTAFGGVTTSTPALNFATYGD